MDSEGVTELQREEVMEPEGENEQEREDDEGKKDETDRQRDQERGEMTRDVEDWNGFLAAGGEHAAQEEVVLDWKPGDPVTPQYVLRLPGYTDGEVTI